MRSFQTCIITSIACILSACSNYSDFRTDMELSCAVKASRNSILVKDIILYETIDYENDEDTGLPYGFFPAAKINLDIGKKYGFIAAWRTTLEWNGFKSVSKTTKMPHGGDEYSVSFDTKPQDKLVYPLAFTLEKTIEEKWYGTLVDAGDVNDEDIISSSHSIY